jgi:hypothetical protein
MDMIERLRKSMQEVTFCYEKEDGEGFIRKNECKCTEDKYKSCQGIKDHERFHERFKELGMDYGDFKRRAEIIKTIKPEFKDSKWWERNVKE